MSKVITLANPVRPPSELHYRTEKGNKIVVDNNLQPPRLLTEEEVRENGYYDELIDLAKIFNHEMVEFPGGDPEGRFGGKPVWRWRPNLFMDWIHDYAAVYSPSAAESHADGEMPYTRGCKEHRASLNMNGLVMDLHRGMFTMEEWMKFYMQIGYSLSGYYEVFGQHEAAEYELPGAKKPKKNRDAYTETVIDYMVRVHKGKVLKL